MESKNRFLWIDRDPTLYTSNYIGLFDLTKGILMIMIILLHCVFRHYNIMFYSAREYPLLGLLLSPLAVTSYGGAPMLFMSCGYGIRRQSVKKYTKNQLTLFLIPYFCVILCMILAALLKWFLVGGSLAARLVYRVLPFFLGFHPGSHFRNVGIAQIGPIWFFFTYTFASILLNWILQESRSWVQLLYLVMGTVAAFILKDHPRLFCIPQILICSGFLYAGMQLKKWKIPQQKIPVPAFLLIYGLCIFLHELGGLAEIANNVYVFGAIDLITAYLAGVMLLCVMLRLNVLQGILPDCLRWIGRHMMWICCIHTVCELAMPWERVGQLFADCPLTGLLLETLFSLAFALLGCVLLNGCVKKILVARRTKIHR